MDIIYGGMVVNLLPVLWGWWTAPTALVSATPAVPQVLRWALGVMAAGVLLSGLRDLYAALGGPGGVGLGGAIKDDKALQMAPGGLYGGGAVQSDLGFVGGF